MRSGVFGECSGLSAQREDGGRLRRSLRAAAEAVIWLDRFTRTAYFGFTSMLVMIGAGIVGDPGPTQVFGLLAVAMCFQVYTYVLNDVIDLPVDVTQPRRTHDALVRGMRGEGGMLRRTGLVIALLPVPLAAAITLMLGGGLAAWLALAASFLGLAVYNVWGKRCPVPPATDLFQALGWASFALYGAWIANPSAGWAELIDSLLPMLSLGIGLIVLITGVHGGLRDLVNDLRQGRTNASIFLGAVPASPADELSNSVRSSWAVVAYSFGWLLLMYGPVFLFLDPEREHYASAARHALATLGTVGLFAANAYLLWQVSRPHQPDRDPWISRQAVAIWIPGYALFLPSALLSSGMTWVVLATMIVPPLFQVKTGQWLLDRLDPREPAPATEPGSHSTPGSALGQP